MNKVTIQDIARAANVSKSTVSRVLNGTAVVNEEKRQAVLAATERLEFRPNVVARSLASGRSMTIGILTQNIGSPFYDTVAQGVIAGMAGTGYSQIFVDGQWEQTTESEVIQTLLGRNVDGLVLIGGALPVDELNELKDKLPTIVVGRKVDGWDDQCIHVDNVDAGLRATRHLLDLGHRDIAFIRGIKDHPDAIDRCTGYTQALTDAGIVSNPDLVIDGDFSGEAGVLAINCLMERELHFTAVFAANDMVAFGARLALYRHGLRVPEDVSVVGFDDQAEAAFATPPLTTMRQPAAEMGSAAAEALIRIINGEDFEVPPLQIELQARESTAPLQ